MHGWMDRWISVISSNESNFSVRFDSYASAPHPLLLLIPIPIHQVASFRAIHKQKEERVCAQQELDGLHSSCCCLGKLYNVCLIDLTCKRK